MKIIIGSKNKLKIQTITDISKSYSFLGGASVQGIEIDSQVSAQPKSLDETVAGAIYRAKEGFKDCDLSFGLEGGLIKVPGTKTGYLKLEVCAIYDGKEIHLGTSCGFEIPRRIFRMVEEENLELSEACFKSGITTHPKVGTEGGLVGILTKDRITRGDQIKQAVISALIHLENKDLYLC